MTRHFDLLDGDFYVDDPYVAYRWLRENDPVVWDDTNELWGVSRYDDIVEIEKAKHLFVNSDQVKGGYRPNIPADASIIALDDPQHTARRLLVARRFTPRAVASFEDHIRDVVRNLIDRFVANGGGDIVTELAAPLPAMMIGLLLGFPDELAPKLQEWSERSIALGGGPRYMNEDGTTAVMEFVGACAELYEEKLECPAGDVMSTWIDAERRGMSDGTEFGLDQIISDCLLLLDGGAETTRTVIARTLVNLMDRPDQWARLRAGADLTVATEEFIRYVTPIHNMCRTAVEDTTVAETDIAAGDQLVLMYSSANRDPAHFDDPETLDVTRHPNHHIAFGFGTHFCLGASLARLEIRTFFEEFVTRVADFAMAPGAQLVEAPNAFVYGLSQARVEIEAA